MRSTRQSDFTGHKIMRFNIIFTYHLFYEMVDSNLSHGSSGNTYNEQSNCVILL